jgi:transposase
LVAGVFDQLEIAEIIDDRIPKLRNHNLEHSKVIKAMVLNSLGYVGQRLYLLFRIPRSSAAGMSMKPI